MKIFVPIVKIEERDDGTLFVAGIASSEALDSQGEVITSDAMKAALPDFFKYGTGNLREMHQPIAAGRVDKAEVGEDGKTYIECVVVDPIAVKKVQENVYKGFSVGGRATEKNDGVISGLRLSEISLVDRPANPEAVISVWKADGMEDQPAEHPVEVEKGLWTAKEIIEALGCMRNVANSAEWEAKEGEKSEAMVTALKDAVKVIGDLAQRYLAEEMNPPVASPAVEMADAAGDVEKAGATFSRATKASLAKIQGMLRDCDKMMTDLGYESAEEKSDAEADLVKADAVSDDVLALAKAAGLELAEGSLYADIAKAALADLAKAQARVKELEAQPEAPKASLTAVEKGADVKDGLHSDTPAANPNDPLAMMKAALRRPMIIGAAPVSKPSSAT